MVTVRLETLLNQCSFNLNVSFCCSITNWHFEEKPDSCDEWNRTKESGKLVTEIWIKHHFYEPW